MTDGGAVLVAFFAEYPEGKVVDGSVLARAVDDNSDDISDAVRTVCRANLYKFTGFTMLRSLYNRFCSLQNNISMCVACRDRIVSLQHEIFW